MVIDDPKSADPRTKYFTVWVVCIKFQSTVSLPSDSLLNLCLLPLESEQRLTDTEQHLGYTCLAQRYAYG
jgi:hypothetical protein